MVFISRTMRGVKKLDVLGSHCTLLGECLAWRLDFILLVLHLGLEVPVGMGWLLFKLVKSVGGWDWD